LYSSEETTDFVSVCHNIGFERRCINSQRPEICLGKTMWTCRKT